MMEAERSAISELFSSPLVTGSTTTLTFDQLGMTVSIARRDQLCASPPEMRGRKGSQGSVGGRLDRPESRRKFPSEVLSEVLSQVLSQVLLDVSSMVPPNVAGCGRPGVLLLGRSSWTSMSSNSWS
jgi:hypothetical protein